MVFPTKFKGDVTQWRHWYMKFSSFLNRRDARWPKLLEEARKHSQNPLNSEDELAMARKTHGGTARADAFKGFAYAGEDKTPHGVK